MADNKPQVFLESDDEIRGQKYVCLSFLTPQKVLLRRKEHFFLSKFLEFFALDYKVKATESFVLDQLRGLQNTLSDIQLELENERISQGDKEVASKLGALAEKVTSAREELARKTPADLETHVKANMSDFRESKITEEWDRYMAVKGEALEEEFHKDNNFQTTVHGLKVRGIYANHDQAVARAKALNKKDPYFNVYVADVGEWLPWDPNPDQVESGEYQNEHLNKLMQSYKENMAQKDAFFEEQKRQKLAEAAAAAEAAKREQKKAVFGAQGEEQPAAEIARDMFKDGPADLAIQRKQEAAAAVTEGATDTIQLA